MTRLPQWRTLTGAAAVLAGAATVGATLLTATHVSAAAVAPTVYMVVTVSDSSGSATDAAGDHQFLPGSTVTLTVTVANSSTVGTATFTQTASPEVVVTTASGISFLGANSSEWACGVDGPIFCSDSNALPPGQTHTALITASVVGLPGDRADATATVNDNGGAVDVASPSNTDTHSAVVANSGAYTKDVPPGSFGQKVGLDQVVNGSTQTYTFTDGTVTVHVGIPDGALPDGTMLALYRADDTFWNSTLSASSSRIVDGYAASWASGSNTNFAASSSITVDVADPAVSSTQSLHRATTSGLGTQTGTVSNGGWVVAFTEDPGFVLAQAAAAPATSTTTQPASTTTVVAPTTGGGPAAPSGAPALPLSAGILLVIAGTGLIGIRRRRPAGDAVRE